jgi:urocanate hydratase
VPVASPARSRRKEPTGANKRCAWACIKELLAAAESLAVGPADDGASVGLGDAVAAVAVRLVCDEQRRRERATAAVRSLVDDGFLIHREGRLWLA